MKVFVEHIYHLRCDTCQEPFAISDRKPEIGARVNCPDPTCNAVSIVEAIESSPRHALKNPELSKVLPDK